MTLAETIAEYLRSTHDDMSVKHIDDANAILKIIEEYNKENPNEG